MATAPVPGGDQDERVAGSQFIITLGDNLDYLNGKAAIFGKVVEDTDVLDKINQAFVDSSGWPLKDIRIRHTIIIDDPYPDPPGLVEPPESPLPSTAQKATVRIADDEELEEESDPEALERIRREREAQAQALTLEMMGDLPFAEVKPPENVLFVCKLNPVTQGEDLELIFSRFGKILSCEVIRDRKTGDSLQYAFIEFENQKDCEQAYTKMQDVLVDDHRIYVDFSQSVSKLSDHWRDQETAKRRRGGGGWGGVKELEKKRQYRAEDVYQRSGEYGMVFDKSKGRPRDRSRSPRQEVRGRDDRRDRSRSRDQDHRHDDRLSDKKRYRDDRGQRDDRDHWRR
jgi:peptidyl-prolyl cis-trans isomerase-like 4